MENQNKVPSHVPLALLIYVPILLSLIHRVAALQLSYQRTLAFIVTGVYFLVPAGIFFVVLGGLLNFRKFYSLKKFFPKETPPLLWLVYKFIWFVIPPVGAW